MSNTEATALPVLFEDAHLLAVRKPSGMPVQPDPTEDPDLLTELRRSRREPSLELVHRIDRPVSGAVLLARSPEANARMNVLFRERRVEKSYLAIIEGSLPGDEHQWKIAHAIEHDARVHRARATEALNDGETHRLDVTRLAQGDRYTLIEVIPEGGAFHQIRAQLGAWGHPIKGDVKYGARRGEKDRSIALHAHRLSFIHPISNMGVRIEAVAPAGPLWDALLALVPFAARPDQRP